MTGSPRRMTRPLLEIEIDLKRAQELLEGPQSPGELRRIHERIEELEAELEQAKGERT